MVNLDDDIRKRTKCKYCDSYISAEAKICHKCKSYQKKWRNIFRISDVILILSLIISLFMVILTHSNLQESKEQRIKAADAFKIANEAADNASDAVTRAQNAAERVSKAEESVNRTVTRVKELEQSSIDMNRTTKQIQIQTSRGFKVFESNMKDMKEDSSTIALYYKVRGGDRSALNNLRELSSRSVQRRGMLAKSLLNDANLYFQDYKFSFIAEKVITKMTNQYYRMSAEELFHKLYNAENAGMREAVVNDVADRDLKYFVEDLVKIVRDDSNLKVACRAEKAVEKLTGERFENFPPYPSVQQWWDNTGRNEKKYLNPLHRLKEVQTLLNQKEYDKSLEILSEMTNSQKGMCNSHAQIAWLMMTVEKNMPKAKQHLKIATEECDMQEAATFSYARILFQENKKDEAIAVLSKFKSFIEPKSDFREKCRRTFPDQIHDDKFLKLIDLK